MSTFSATESKTQTPITRAKPAPPPISDPMASMQFCRCSRALLPQDRFLAHLGGAPFMVISSRTAQQLTPQFLDLPDAEQHELIHEVAAEPAAERSDFGRSQPILVKGHPNARAKVGVIARPVLAATTRALEGLSVSPAPGLTSPLGRSGTKPTLGGGRTHG